MKIGLKEMKKAYKKVNIDKIEVFRPLKSFKAIRACSMLFWTYSSYKNIYFI